MKQIAKLAIALVVTLNLSGCLSQTAIMPNEQIYQSPNPWTVIDQRPEAEKGDEFLSLFAHSCSYGIKRLGDDRTSPPRIAILRADLSRELREAGNKTIAIQHYAIYFNKGLALLKSSPYSGGLLGQGEIAHRLACKKEDTAAGWFDADEVSTPFSPIIVEISATMGDRAFVVRSVYSPSEELNGAFGEPNEASALFAAMRQATAELAHQIRYAKFVH